MVERFIDEFGTRGGQSDALSRTIAKKKFQKIQFHYITGKNKFMLSIPGYDMISVSKRNAERLAQWILTFKESVNVTPEKANLGRKSKRGT